MASEHKKSTKKISRLGETKVKEMFQLWDWTPRKDEDDEGVDFCVESPLQDDGFNTRILVQVKTSEKQKESQKGDWSISIKRSAARRYENSRLPVFLFAVSLSESEVRFAYLQSEIARLDSDAWNNKWITIHLSKESHIGTDGGVFFASAATDAWNRQDDKYAPPDKALARMARAKNSLDERFKVDVSLSSAGYLYSISASSEPVTIGFKVKPSGNEDVEQLSNAIRFGLPGKAKVDEIRFSGSPIFESIGDKGGGLSLETRPRKISLALGVIENEGRADSGHCRRILEIGCDHFQGLDGAHIKFDSKENPLGLSLSLTKGSASVTASFSLNSDVWVGCEIARLPYCEKIVDLFESLSRCGWLGIEVMNGDQSYGILRCELDTAMKSKMVEFYSGLVPVFSLQKIARHFASKAIWKSGDIRGSDANDWLIACRLLDGLAVPMEKKAFFVTDAESDIAYSKPKDFALRGSVYSVGAFGQEICSFPIIIRFMGWEISRSSEIDSGFILTPNANSICQMVMDGTDDDFARLAFPESIPE